MSSLLPSKLARPSLGLLAAALVLAGGAVSCKKAESPAKETTTTGTSLVPAAPGLPADSAAPAEVQKMFGRWLRSDGTYVLELRGADRSGVLQAAYFNPRSINVSRAIWMRGAEGLQVVVELNDVGYPGATYVLSHDVKNDVLVGKYNQPQMGQTFDVDFVRQKKLP